MPAIQLVVTKARIGCNLRHDIRCNVRRETGAVVTLQVLVEVEVEVAVPVVVVVVVVVVVLAVQVPPPLPS